MADRQRWAWPGPLRLGGHELPVVGRARVYVCGITPYDTTHLGHAATFVWADVAARVLRLTGAEVEVCRNVTDLDDDLLRQAQARDVDWRSLATRQTNRFEADMADLRVERPSHEPHARDHVEEVVALGRALLSAGAAYERAGAVWFRGEAVPVPEGMGPIEDAGTPDGNRPGHGQAEPDDPRDAAVWQPSADADPGWPSPWGRGRPGWHAECAAMALAILGPGVDLHVGGADLTFPHHAYEAAMAEAASGVRPFARAWLHVGAVHHGGAKMAKSTGNLVLVHDLLERWSPEAIRLAILARPYDEPWQFDEADLATASQRLEDLWRAAGRPGGDDHATRAAVLGALFDELDVPRALAAALDAGGPVTRELAAAIGLV
jgi:cysteinyl-tRNA synthetase